MSGLLAGKVWLSNLDRKLKPLAATLADIANDDGTSIYPSVSYVAWRLGSSERFVQLGLKKLRLLGVLQVVANEYGGRGMTVQYRLVEERLPARTPWGNHRKGEKHSPISRCSPKGEKDAAKGRKAQQKRVNPCSPDTSLPVREQNPGANIAPSLSPSESDRRKELADRRKIEARDRRERAEASARACMDQVRAEANVGAGPSVGHNAQCCARCDRSERFHRLKPENQRRHDPKWEPHEFVPDETPEVCRMGVSGEKSHD